MQSRLEVKPMADHALEVPSTPAKALFVAVFVGRDSSEQDHATIRRLWKQVDGGSDSICMRFALCKHGADDHQHRLLAENTTHGDMLFLDFQEGYSQGLLTKKVVASLRAFLSAESSHDQCLNRPLYMKIDDDTFVAAQPFRSNLSSAFTNMGASFLYAGVEAINSFP